MIGVVHRGRLRRNLLIYGDLLGLNPWRFGVIGFAIGMIATVFELGGADRFLGLSLFLQFFGDPVSVRGPTVAQCAVAIRQLEPASTLLPRSVAHCPLPRAPRPAFQMEGQKLPETDL